MSGKKKVSASKKATPLAQTSEYASMKVTELIAEIKRRGLVMPSKKLKSQYILVLTDNDATKGSSSRGRSKSRSRSRSKSRSRSRSPTPKRLSKDDVGRKKYKDVKLLRQACEDEYKLKDCNSPQNKSRKALEDYIVANYGVSIKNLEKKAKEVQEKEKKVEKKAKEVQEKEKKVEKKAKEVQEKEKKVEKAGGDYLCNKVCEKGKPYCYTPDGLCKGARTKPKAGEHINKDYHLIGPSQDIERHVAMFKERGYSTKWPVKDIKRASTPSRAAPVKSKKSKEESAPVKSKKSKKGVEHVHTDPSSGRTFVGEQNVIESLSEKHREYEYIGEANRCSGDDMEKYGCSQSEYCDIEEKFCKDDPRHPVGDYILYVKDGPNKGKKFIGNRKELKKIAKKVGGDYDLYSNDFEGSNECWAKNGNNCPDDKTCRYRYGCVEPGRTAKLSHLYFDGRKIYGEIGELETLRKALGGGYIATSEEDSEIEIVEEPLIDVSIPVQVQEEAVEWSDFEGSSDESSVDLEEVSVSGSEKGAEIKKITEVFSKCLQSLQKP
jgi:hypothetical protein